MYWAPVVPVNVKFANVATPFDAVAVLLVKDPPVPPVIVAVTSEDELSVTVAELTS